MARQPRLTVAAYPHHVILRGNNRQAIVLDDQDRTTLRAWLGEYAEQFKVALHAYVLMDNHLHLLLTPEDDTGLPSLMQALGRRYVRYFNHRHGRTGTLWEGRYRSTLIESEAYLLACMVYIDLNPVRAGMVAEPQDYSWSSHLHCIGQKSDKRVTHHALYWALGNTPFAREAAYRELVQAGLERGRVQDMTRHLLTGKPLGSVQFIEHLSQSTGRQLLPARVGRPHKKPSTAV